MRQIYAFEDGKDYYTYKEFTDWMIGKLDQYRKQLIDMYSLKELPKGIVWTTTELATKAFSDVPIPAYTRKELIFMSPDLQEWRQLFLYQLEDRNLPNIKTFYENYSANQLATILGHELTHHIDLFAGDFDDDDDWASEIWFEEGMCEYLSRKLMLSKEEFDEITMVESALVEEFKDKYGKHSLDEFGASRYKGNITSIMYDYWRSFLVVKDLVEDQANGDIFNVFEQYMQWYNEGKPKPLSAFFAIKSFF